MFAGNREHYFSVGRSALRGADGARWVEFLDLFHRLLVLLASTTQTGPKLLALLCEFQPGASCYSGATQR